MLEATPHMLDVEQVSTVPNTRVANAVLRLCMAKAN